MRRQALICVWLMEHEKGTQLEIAKALKVSLSTVNNVIKTLEKMGAVDIGRRGLHVVDKEKVLMFLANLRNPHRDIIYKTRVEAPVREIEESMPSGVGFTAYSGYKFKYGDVPADYSEVYVYADEEALEEIKRRFPLRKGPPNLFVLRKETETVSDALLFADLWNLPEWYAKDFVRELRGRILE